METVTPTTSTGDVVFVDFVDRERLALVANLTLMRPSEILAPFYLRSIPSILTTPVFESQSLQGVVHCSRPSAPESNVQIRWRQLSMFFYHGIESSFG